MNVFQVPYNWIRNLRSPEWFKKLTLSLWEHVVMPSILKMGELAIVELQRLIIKASNMEVSNKDKFIYVFTEFRKQYTPAQIKDQILNLGIEMLYAELKAKGIIK